MRGITLGSEVHLQGGDYTALDVAGGNVRLLDHANGGQVVMNVVEIAATLIDSENASAGPNLRDRAPGDLDNVSERVEQHIKWLIPQLEEVINGAPVPPNTSPRPEYDPQSSSLTTRIARKSKELTNAGHAMAERSLRRKIDSYRKRGAAGLIDRRTLRQERPLSRADPRVIDALIAVIDKETSESSGTNDRLGLRLRTELTKRHPGENIAIPKRSTLAGYIKLLGAGKYTTGNSVNRRTAANSPKNRMQHSRPVIMPGSEVQIDSSKFDVLVTNTNGNPERVSLTIMLDRATMSIIATALTPVAAKGVDHALMLARCFTPRELRPGNTDFIDFDLPEMPWAHLLDSNEKQRYNTTRPFIAPRVIMQDNGADYTSEVFKSACNMFGISRIEASVRTPTDKAAVERIFKSIKLGFAQHLPGFSGGSVDRRGAHPERDPGLLDIFTLSELFERWVDVVWQNTPKEALRDPLAPSIVHSPNSMYTAIFDMTGFVPVPLNPLDYIALLPVDRRTIQYDGINFNRRVYDSPQLHPYRLQPSGDKLHNGQWTFHYDPYNPSAVWLKDPDAEGWIQCDWVNSDTFIKPFSRTIRLRAREITAQMNLSEDERAIQFAERVIALAPANLNRIREQEERSNTVLELRTRAGLRLPILDDDSLPATNGTSAEWDDNDGDYTVLPDFDPMDGVK